MASSSRTVTFPSSPGCPIRKVANAVDIEKGFRTYFSAREISKTAKKLEQAYADKETGVTVHVLLERHDKYYTMMATVRGGIGKPTSLPLANRPAHELDDRKHNIRKYLQSTESKDTENYSWTRIIGASQREDLIKKYHKQVDEAMNKDTAPPRPIIMRLWDEVSIYGFGIVDIDVKEQQSAQESKLIAQVVRRIKGTYHFHSRVASESLADTI